MLINFLKIGGILGFLSVLLGAFAAHGLKKYADITQLNAFETAVKYQFYHSFALLAVGMLYAHFPFKPMYNAGVFFLVGVILFSGSIFIFTLMDIKNIPVPALFRLITPIGGLFLLAGWACFIFSFFQSKS